MLPPTRFASLPAGTRQGTDGVTYPRGFRAAGVACGIKRSRRLDLGLLVSDEPCVSAAFFTQNAAAAAPVIVTRDHCRQGAIRACVVNSGNANACTGAQGEAAALRMRSAAAQALSLADDEVAVSSTGVIGPQLPIEKVETGIAEASAQLSADGGLRFSSAIRTTDRSLKRGSLHVKVPGGEVRLGFATKGAGMICPNMATTLSFVTCDAAVSADNWQELVREAVAVSFNRITVDGQESTNDMVLALANGASGVQLDDEGRRIVGEALNAAMISLAIAVAADGEGASTVVRLSVTGAADTGEAEAVARAIADSPLVKTAFYGDDANWGRVAQAAGQALSRQQAGLARPLRPLALPLQLDIAFGPVTVVAGDQERTLTASEQTQLRDHLELAEVDLSIDLHRGEAATHLYFSDLTHQYVTLNAEYTT
jgi:glutamate N-acetyltransferase / amino-acid N-acetyltransferase